MALLRTAKRKYGHRIYDDITQRTWHRRKLVNVGGSITVTIPKALIKWDQKRLAEPFRWQVGDEVEIAITTDSRFVIRYSPVNDARLGDLPTDEVKLPTDEEISRTLLARFEREATARELKLVAQREERREKARKRARAQYARERYPVQKALKNLKKKRAAAAEEDDE